jgi:hypothetical protein
MNIFPIVLIALVVLLVADVLRWKVVIGRELKRRDLVRIGAAGLRITPTKGYRLIGACICKREGKKYQVVILNRGWFRTRPSIEIVEI